MTSFNSKTESFEAQAQFKPNGAAAAAIVAAAIGSAFFGLLIILAELNTVLHDQLIISKAVGTLSGKSTYATVTWLVIWVILHSVWRKKDVNLERISLICMIGIGLSVLFTFPPFFTLFG